MRNFITLCTMLAAHGLSAQVTLNYWMQAPTGTTVSIHLLTDMGSAVVPSDGINQIWDLSSVTLADLGDMTIQVAAGTPYAANYPNANWAYVQDLTGIGMEYIYFNINTTVLELVADDVPGGPNPYTDPKHILEFPLQYGNSFSDTYTDNDGTFTVTWTYAGHGTASTGYVRERGEDGERRRRHGIVEHGSAVHLGGGRWHLHRGLWSWHERRERTQGTIPGPGTEPLHRPLADTRRGSC